MSKLSSSCCEAFTPRRFSGITIKITPVFYSHEGSLSLDNAKGSCPFAPCQELHMLSKCSPGS